MIEYTAFYGSFQIFNYLQFRNCEITPSLYICAVHGENPEIIDFLENKLPLKNNPNLAQDCYFEAIKCYNDEMAQYFADKYLPSENLIDFTSHCYRYDFLFNFDFINEKMIGNLSFEKLCQTGSYFYCQIYLLQNPSFDINKIAECKRESENSPRIYYYGANDRYTKFYRQSKSEQENPLLIQMIEKGYTDVVEILLNHLNTDANIEYTFTEKCHRWEYEYNCGRNNMFGRDDDEEVETIQSTKAALIIAVENNNDEIVQLLLNNPKIDVNVRHIILKNEEVKGWEEARYHHSLFTERITKIKKTALYIALQNKNTEIVKMLLKHPNIDINIRYSKKKSRWSNSCIKKTPLHFAIEHDNVDIIKLLLQNKNIDVNVPYIKDGYTDFYDDDSDEREINSSDDSYDDNDDYIHDDEKRDQFYQSNALLMAVKDSKIEIVKHLLQNSDINVNIKFESSDIEIDGKTALHFAVANGNDEIVNLLLQNQFIDVNIKDSKTID